VCLDFFTLWSVARVSAEGAPANIYQPDIQTRMADRSRELALASASRAQQQAAAVSDHLYNQRLDATGSPFAYALIGLLSSGDYDADLKRFSVASYVLFLAAIALMCHLLRYSVLGAALLFVVLGMCFTPLLSDVRVANINQLQLGALGVFLWASHRRQLVWAGVVLGLSIVFKPVTVAVLVVLLAVAVIDRRVPHIRRLLLGVSAGAAVGVAVGSVYFSDAAIWRHFVESIGRTLGAGYPLANGNFSLSALVAGTGSTWLSLACGLIAFVVVAAVVARSRRSHGDAGATASDQEHFLVVGVGCCLMLLGSRLVWLHYYVLLIPLVIYLLRPRPDSQTHVDLSSGAALIALLLFAPALQSLLTNPAHAALAANLAALIMFAASVRAWWHVRRSPLPGRLPHEKRRRMSPATSG
jgi:hypothetical protein